ncbi:MAG: hypothetical protein Q4E46_00340 [Candidatus Saccharibacteria bacterium]|nr:hypothetical protein [Candidatus Saccharibacteria bacterium]
MKNNIKVRQKQASAKTVLFFICYTVLVFHSMLKTVNFLGPIIFGRFTYHLALLLLGFLSLASVSKLQKGKIALFFFVTLFITIACIIAKDLFLAVIWLTILAAKSLNINKLIKYDILIKSIGLIIVFLSFILGITSTETLLIRDGTVRQTLGFGNPNELSSHILSIYIDYLFLNRNNDKLAIKTALAIILSLFIYFVAGSRTQIIGIIIALVLLTKKKQKEKALSRVKILMTSCLFAVLTGISFFATVTYVATPNRLEWLNELLSGRLWLAARAYKTYGIGFVGNVRVTKDMLDYPIDNAYMYFLVIYGIIPLIALGIFIGKYAKYLLETKNSEILLALTIYMLLGMSETELFRPIYNTYFIPSSNMLLNEKGN